ncbi:MAG: glycosyltransferase family 2 protein, partial [Planctomycetes bacterium]|nr:glycosyltransferase family 2 protein [Planctomycetota bacterium]
MNHHPLARASGLVSKNSADAGARKVISIVTPCYNEELNVVDCYEAVRDLFANTLTDYDFEHVFCDNASTDQTPGLLAGLAARDPRVKVIFNAGNFGPFRSMFNGLMSTSGDAVVVLLAADLQDPPEVIAEFVKHWEAGYEIVHAVRSQREEGPIMRGVRHVYYRTVRKFADIDVKSDV